MADEANQSQVAQTADITAVAVRQTQAIELEAEPIYEAPPPPRVRGMRRLLRWIPGANSVVAVCHYLMDDEAPATRRFVVLLSLIYLISPMDLIPDWVTGPLGFADDFAVFWGLLTFLGSATLKPYRLQARAWLRGESAARTE